MGPEGAGIGHPTATASFTSPPLFALKDFLKSFFWFFASCMFGLGVWQPWLIPPTRESAQD